MEKNSPRERDSEEPIIALGCSWFWAGSKGCGVPSEL